MQFVSLYTNQTINTDDYLACFVDEYTGEVKDDRRVLDKRVRKLWFRSSMPKAVIHTDVKVSCQQMTTENASVPSALAYVQVLDENGGVLAENWSHRQAVSFEGEKPFAYYTEAAINSAVDRCLIDLGFVVPEELEKTPAIGATSNPSPQQQAIADIEQMIDDGNDSVNPPLAPSYDKTTPVDEILKVMDAATARRVVFENGKYKGKTVGEVYETTKDNQGFSSKLRWFADNYRSNNILVAACLIVNK